MIWPAHSQEQVMQGPPNYIQSGPTELCGIFVRLCGDFRQIMWEILQIMQWIVQYYAGLCNILQVLKLKMNVRNFTMDSHKSDETCVRFGQQAEVYSVDRAQVPVPGNVYIDYIGTQVWHSSIQTEEMEWGNRSKYIYTWWCLCNKFTNSIPTIWIPDKSWKTVSPLRHMVWSSIRIFQNKVTKSLWSIQISTKSCLHLWSGVSQ